MPKIVQIFEGPHGDTRCLTDDGRIWNLTYIPTLPNENQPVGGNVCPMWVASDFQAAKFPDNA